MENGMTAERAILIAGPTASGKSALALRLAEERGGTIINADSMQVYRELRVLTARPSVADEARVPHLLYGHVAGSDPYSAGRFVVEAADAIAQARAAGRVPIVVGGTGLYFKALTEGLSPVPSIPEDVRVKWREMAQRISPAELHAELLSRDAEMAGRLSPTDPQRVTRALEVLDATGRSLAEWQAKPGTPVLTSDNADCYVVETDRDVLYRRCDARFDEMLDAGALDEVRGLAALDLSPDLPVMRALGVRPLLQLIVGTLGRTAAVARAKTETRQFVKRQLTWISSNMNSWNLISAQ